MLAQFTGRADGRPVSRPLVKLLVLLIVSFPALAATPLLRPNDRLAARPEPAPALILVQTATHSLVLDARSGQIVSQQPGTSAILAADPGGRLVLSITYDRVTVSRLPSWSTVHVLSIDSEIPPAQAVRRAFPALGDDSPRPYAAEVSPDARYAAVGFVSMAPEPSSWWILWVATLDLERGTWASWALPVPGAHYAYLLPASNHLFVLARDNAVANFDTAGSLYRLDPDTGTLQGQVVLRSAEPGFAPIAGTAAARVPAVTGAHLGTNTLAVLTERLELFVFDPTTLRPVEHRAPISAEILAREIAWLDDDRVIALTQTEELVMVDLANATIATRLPLSGLFGTQLVGADPTTGDVLVMGYPIASEPGSACLYRFGLDGTRDTLSCGLDLNLYERRFARTGPLS